jgi:hypothetical protein
VARPVNSAGEDLLVNPERVVVVERRVTAQHLVNQDTCEIRTEMTVKLGISEPQTTDVNLGQAHCLALRAPTLDVTRDHQK